MKFDKETEFFITKYVKALRANNAVIFAGAGMSVSEGFFDWKKLLKPIADRMGLDIEEEQHNLTALAQMFVDSQGGVRGELDQILVEEYGKAKLSLSENHRILARLPIQIYWTTNYDRLIETALLEQKKTPDVKKAQGDLTTNLPKRDAIVYKMHGDIGTVTETVLTKHEYEDYNNTRELFSNAFKSDYVARTFLFIGFSFADPNLDYLISRIRSTLGKNVKPDYYFIKKDFNDDRQKRQQLKANSLLTYGLNAVWVDNYSDITNILKEIETRMLRSTILVSGSAEIYGRFSKDEGTEFIHDLSKEISKNSYKILTGFGLGIGSAVINGVLDNMQSEHNQNLDNYLIMRPFPQIKTKGKEIKELWTEYRNNFIPHAGIAVFVFGNKAGKNPGDIVDADGMVEEFDIAINNGLMVIPVGATGFTSAALWQKVTEKFELYYGDNKILKQEFIKLNDSSLSNKELIQTILNIINHLNSK